MKPGDYFLKEDVAQITEEGYSSNRTYLRLLGFKCTDVYGIYQKFDNINYQCVELYVDGDLCWASYIPEGNRIPLSEMKRMAALGMLV